MVGKARGTLSATGTVGEAQAVRGVDGGEEEEGEVIVGANSIS